jgi:hypothetical protein
VKILTKMMQVNILRIVLFVFEISFFSGVKRPSELNQTHTIDDGNSNTKTNQSSRGHPTDRRSDFRYDAEYNPPKYFIYLFIYLINSFLNRRGNWREQRPAATNNRRGGGPNNYSMNNSKQNQRSEQTQYTASRSSEQQSTNNRQQQYKPRNARFQENRSPHEGRDSPLQISNDETTRGQRINSGSFSQGQNSGPTSPSTTVPARTVYANNRPPIGRNSPAPYTGSSSSRNNSTTATSPPPSYQTNSTGNYSQQSNNKNNKKQIRSNSLIFIGFYLVILFKMNNNQQMMNQINQNNNVINNKHLQIINQIQFHSIVHHNYILNKLNNINNNNNKHHHRIIMFHLH